MCGEYSIVLAIVSITMNKSEYRNPKEIQNIENYKKQNNPQNIPLQAGGVRGGDPIHL
jgi:hypothetical protein